MSEEKDKVQHVLTSVCCGCGRYGAERCSLLQLVPLSGCLVASEHVWEPFCGLWEEAAKRIPLRMYKRSGAACISSDYEIPLASEESRRREERGPGCAFTTGLETQEQVLLCMFVFKCMT